jgi:hypothetical protein
MTDDELAVNHEFRLGDLLEEAHQLEPRGPRLPVGAHRLVHTYTRDGRRKRLGLICGGEELERREGVRRAHPAVTTVWWPAEP